VREGPARGGGGAFTTSSGEGKMRGGLVEGGGLKWESSIRRRVLAYTTKVRFLQLTSYACCGGGSRTKNPLF